MVEKRREALMAQMDSLSTHDAQKKLTAETHELAQRKVEQMEKLKSALGVSQDKEGDAFNRELQVRVCMGLLLCCCILDIN
jgi:serine/arginine repetitive matrix protein 2